MTDAIDTATSGESEPHSPVTTYGKVETKLGKDGARLLVQFDTLHDKVVPQMQEIIVKFGRVLLAGREQHFADDRGFGAWVVHFHLDTGKLGRDQKERNACMQIAKLFDQGMDDEEEGSTPRKLDLAGCNHIVPTNIMKWVRKDQPEIIPDLKDKQQKRAQKKKPPKDVEELEPDEVGDLGVVRKQSPVVYLTAVRDMLTDNWNEISEDDAVAIKQLLQELVKLTKAKRT